MVRLLKFSIVVILLLLAVLALYYYFPESHLPKDAVVDRIVVWKANREMKVYEKGQLLKTYRISLGLQPVGAKQVEGDMKTPEGLYQINGKNANSAYHKNLGISYPNKKDRKHAQSLGKPAGGDIKIHGFPNGTASPGKFHRFTDWTHGCIALTNEEIDELFAHTAIGTPIEINP